MSAQAKKDSASKGPRAVGLLQIFDNGKASLIPIAFLDQGKFYDASVYKASPVPMALEPGTVYEAYRSGVSQGLFTVGQPLQAQSSWTGSGKWATTDQIAAQSKKSAPEKPASDAEAAGPPRLRRSPVKSEPAPEAASADKSAPPTPAGPAASETSASAPPPTEADDPSRPVLKRGAQPATPPKAAATPDASKASQAASAPAGPAPDKQPDVLLAISDVHPTESRSFLYPIKPSEEQTFRSKMLALATTELRKKMKAAPEEAQGAHKVRSKTTSSKAKIEPEPKYENVQLRVFDLSNNNEPVVVMSATATLPPTSATPAPLPQYVTLVAREDINDELHKVTANITDQQHLDVVPHLEL
ncbi:MAG: hypothetical protein H0X25_10370, partial [Acidobacteriales bacterium]|nr:hypothetical protein [Terriglobales bacterium]